MEPKQKQSNQYIRFQSRWRHSVNQLNKLQQQSKLANLDTVHKNDSTMKLKMKNRLGQIDQDFHPIFHKKITCSHYTEKNKNCRVASTNHDSNIFTINSQGTNTRLQESVILQDINYNPEQYDQKFIYQCHQIRQQLVQELTEYNKSIYADQMKYHCSKYNQSFKSIFYSLIDSPKKQIYQFCYICDQVIKHSKQNAEKKHTHVCETPLTSIFRIQQALKNLKNQLKIQNIKIFDVFLHNALQHQTDVEELIINVTVLKQSLQHEYQPQQAVIRMRLMNLIGKKIGLLIQEKQLEDRLNNLVQSKR